MGGGVVVVDVCVQNVLDDCSEMQALKSRFSVVDCEGCGRIW